MIAVGLLATVAAALLSTEKLIGVATLEWAESSPMPASKAAAIPGGGAMRLTRASIEATEPNIGEYTLFRVGGVLRIDSGSAVGHARLRCAVHVPKYTIVAKTHKSRASYPRSSEELSEQGALENSLVEFSSHGSEYALVEVGDLLGKGYTKEKGIVVEWAPFRIGRQVWKIGLPAGRPARDLTIPLVSIWRTTTTPAARLSCTVENSGGTATVRTAGRLGG